MGNTMAPEVNIAAVFEEVAEECGEYTAYIFNEKKTTNLELIRNAARLANGFQRLGVKSGDRVMFLMSNSPELVTSYLAAFRIGAVVAPVTVSLGRKEIAHIVKNAEPTLMVADLAKSPAGAEVLAGTGIPLVRVDGSAEPAEHYFTDLIADESEDADLVPRKFDELGALIYTSGSTGLPKGVMLTMGNLVRPGGRLFDENGKRRLPPLRTEPGNSILVVPTTHAYGMLVLLTTFFIPTTMALLERFHTETVFKLIEKYKPGLFPGVPTMYRYMLDHPKLNEFDLSEVKVWLSAAAPLPKNVQDEWREKVGAEIIQGYGMTETTAYVSSSIFGVPSKTGSIGRPGPGVEVKIRDEEGRDLPAGEKGEIMVKGLSVMKGYYRDEKSTGQVLEDGWLHTGDVGYLDNDGYIFIVDRKKDLIIRGGFNIFPADVESVLQTHPAVAEAAVVGAPDQTHGEAVIAFVETKAGQTVDPDQLKDFVKDQIASYKVPSQIHVRDSLPRNFVGKVLRRVLREEARSLADKI